MCLRCLLDPDVACLGMKMELVEALESEQPTQTRRLEIDWTESEWFDTWLRLARHEPIEPKEQQMEEAA